MRPAVISCLGLPLVKPALAGLVSVGVCIAQATHTTLESNSRAIVKSMKSTYGANN